MESGRPSDVDLLAEACIDQRIALRAGITRKVLFNEAQ